MSGGAATRWGPERIRPGVGAVVVGRGSAAGVRLVHPAVSRRHADLRAAEGRVVVRDLGSRTGTRVNGVRVQERPLRDGDRVEFGPVAYEYRDRDLLLLPPSDGVRLEARGLSVARGGRRLLSGVDLTIAPNQFVGLLGPSGSGKTTLMKCLAGLVAPASGRLTLDGQDATADPDRCRAVVGYVPQEDVVYAGLTGRENLDFALRLRLADDLASGERAEVVGQTLARLQMGEHADRPVSTLSGGQRKRLNVAVELLARPRVLFLDEPTSGLDPAAEARLMHLLKELAGQGVTVVCATHVMESLHLFDQVVVIAEETAVYSGPPGDLLRRFRVSSFPELYESLDTRARTSGRGGAATLPADSPGPDAVGGVLAGVRLVRPVATPASRTRPARIRLSAQVVVQALRGLRLLIRDRPLLALLAAQPALIGLMINLSQQRPNGTEPVFLFAAVTCVWLGLNNTAREVVRDRAVYVRERLAGVTPEGYLSAKALLFGAVGLVQVGLLVGVIRYANFLSAGDAADLAATSPLYLGLVLWATYLSAMLLGLLVSTLADTQEAAVAALPLIVLPQLLLTGVASGLNSEHDGSFRSVAVLAAKAGEARRGPAGWVLELASLPTYSRPAVALLQRPPADPTLPPAAVVTLTDWMHLLLLLLLTATALAAAFLRRERRWLERG